jgi:hypothetical protein
MPLVADGIFITPVLRALLFAIGFLRKTLAGVCYERVNGLAVGAGQDGVVSVVNGCAFVEGSRRQKPVNLSSGSPSMVEREISSELCFLFSSVATWRWLASASCAAIRNSLGGAISGCP